MQKIVLFFFLFLLVPRQWAHSRVPQFSSLISTKNRSIYHLRDDVCVQLKRGFPHKIVLGKKMSRRIVALSVSPNGKRVMVATKFSLHIYSFKKQRWFSFTQRGLNRFAAFSALCDTGRAIYLGTTCYGVYRFVRGRWSSLRRGLPGEEPVRYRKFYETVTSLSSGPGGDIYAGFHFGRGVYRLRRGRSVWRKIAFSRSIFRVSAIIPSRDGCRVYDGSNWLDSKHGVAKDGVLVLQSKLARNFGKHDTAMAVAGDGYSIGATWPEKINYYKVRRSVVAHKRGLYINSYRAAPWRLRRLIPLMKRKGLNTLVIDVKDDYGRVLYKGSLKVVKRTGAYRRLLRVKKIVALCKKNGIHLVARLVTFKDPCLHRYKRGKYAIKDRYTRGLWNPGSRERWVDPFNSFVRNYNIAIAQEILTLGFDEIQFDYIRFPTDGPTSRTYYPARWKGAWKVDALQNFLAAARKKLNKPFSVDLYGFNCWYSLGRWMGQDLTLFSAYADAISPMHYPSHFDRTFRIERGYAKRTFDILYHGTLRPIALSSRPVAMRPYLQAFRWRAYRYGRSYWEDQVKGVYKGGSKGYIFWDATSRYLLLPSVRFVKK